MPGFADFQGAIWKALNGDPALQTLLGGANKVLDDAPHGSESAAPAYPYVTLGEQLGAEDGASDVQMAAMQITLHAWSRGAGRLQSLQIIDAMRDALEAREDKTPVVAHGVIVHLLYLGHETIREADGETYHGVLRMQGIYQYG